ncbi:LytTR family DNA-binding domain-containing protein [Daejeonella sp. H1SJ63]|uniref:LytR/AlgR family response regulator transcription factor n=1 Tax=Daejeonella sp. H1SJ63 TaxID=3034145 RepID=UPI0023ED9844|nr:LytTR family DNA-binding domain-containing protein [Daejeonella sp. H1SJ63]
MMFTCYIVDDEPHAIETLASYIKKAPGLELLGSSTNPLEALELINTSVHPDITFLDIDMPQLSGLDLAGLISDRTAVIFTTAFPDYALGAFEKNAADYLLKPISFERFLNSVKKVSGHIKTQIPTPENDHIFIKTNIKGKVTRLNLTDLIYVESIKNYVIIYTADEKLITYLTMKELEAALPSERFFRVHKSYIVNADRIKTVNGVNILLQNNIPIPLGQIYKIALQDYINAKLVSSSRLT